MDAKVTEELEKLLAVLETGAAARGRDDAIARVLGQAGRRTEVRSLRDAAEVAAFRQALTDGLIRADTVNRLLRLIHEIVVRLV